MRLGFNVDAEEHYLIGLLLHAVELVGSLDIPPIGNGNDHIVKLTVLQGSDSRGIILDHIPGDLLDLRLAAMIVFKSDSGPRRQGVVIVLIPHVRTGTDLIGNLTEIVAQFLDSLLGHNFHLVQHMANGRERLVHNDFNGIFINLLNMIQRTAVGTHMRILLRMIIAEHNVISGHSLTIVELDTLLQSDNILSGIVIGLDLLSQTQVIAAGGLVQIIQTFIDVLEDGIIVGVGSSVRIVGRQASSITKNERPGSVPIVSVRLTTAAASQEGEQHQSGQ